MKTFIFVEKNGSAILTLSADNEEEAREALADIAKEPEAFRLDECEEEDD